MGHVIFFCNQQEDKEDKEDVESGVIFMNQSAGVVLQVLVAAEAMVKRVKRLEGQTEIKEKMDRVE